MSSFLLPQAQVRRKDVSRRMARLFVTSLALLGTSTLAAAQDVPTGNTTCLDPTVTWYNTADGLNPCQQYERLRRICQPSFQTPLMPATLTPKSTPGACDSQLTDCCCNSVAFNLAVTCAACQWGVGTGHEGDFGIDATVGTYQAFLGTCLPNSRNESLPEITQKAACGQGLDLPSFLYGLFWPDGNLFFHFMYEWATQRNKAGERSSGKCPSSSGSATLAEQSTDGSVTPPTTTGSDKNIIIAVVGGILGAVGLFSTLAVLLWVKYRGNRRTSSAQRYPMPPADQPNWDYRRPPPPRSSSSRSSSSSALGHSYLTPTPPPRVASSHSPRNSSSRPSSTPRSLQPASSTPRSSTSDARSLDLDANDTINPFRTPLHTPRSSTSFRDDKLEMMERRPDGKAPLPYSVASSSSGAGARRDLKAARVGKVVDTGAGGSSSRRGVVRVEEETRSVRPPSYVTSAG